MKICLLTHSMPRFAKDTNSASFISELANGLSDRGNEVLVLAPYDTLFKKYKRGFKVVTYKYIWPNKLHIAGYSRVLGSDKKMKLHMYFFSTLMSISAFFNLIMLTRKYKFEVVTAHWAIPNGVIAYFASLVTSVPYTITIPGSDVYLASKNIVLKFLTRLAVANASFVISDSKHYLDQLVDIDIKPSKMEVIRYGVDVKILKPQKPNTKILKNFSIPKGHNVVLALGRFVEKKGFVYLIKAFPEILKKYPATTLLLVGGGDLQSEFLKLIKKLRISKNVKMPGLIPYQDRAKYYNLADVFVMPSVKDSEGNIDASPVAMMDAMACGVPVVATKYSGSPDLVINGKSGYMIADKSSNEIAKAIVKLLALKNKKEIKANARKIAVKHFSIEKISERYEKLFKTILTL